MRLGGGPDRSLFVASETQANLSHQRRTLLALLSFDVSNHKRNKGDARGASEVCRGTSSIHFYHLAASSSNHVGYGPLDMSSMVLAAAETWNMETLPLRNVVPET